MFLETHILRNASLTNSFEIDVMIKISKICKIIQFLCMTQFNILCLKPLNQTSIRSNLKKSHKSIQLNLMRLSWLASS